MSIKFPITRHQAAKELKRPYSTIVAWSHAFKNPAEVTEKMFRALSDCSVLSRRWGKKNTKRKNKEKEDVKLYLVPSLDHAIVNEAQLHSNIKDGTIKDNYAIYELGQRFRAKQTVTLEKW